MRLAALCLVSLFVGCYHHDALSVSNRECAVARDAAACAAIAGCSPFGCPLSGGGQSFLACIPTGAPSGVDCASTAPSSCTQDADCGAGAYCRGLLSVCRSECQYTIGTAVAAGTCHRSCEGPSACACSDDADCPGPFSHCDQSTHACVSEQPPICHSPSCPAGCQEGTLEEYGAICVCPSC